MRAFLFSTIISLLLFVSSVSALNVTVSVDKTRVLLGENFTLSGKVTTDAGLPTVFTYRAAVVAPKKIIICDSNKTTTKPDGTFSLVCKVPTLEQAISLGIPAASDRSVIPLRAGVVVHDTSTNQTAKKHAKLVLALNPDKFKVRAGAIFSDVDNFIKKAGVILSECDKLIERAQRFNVTSVADRCEALKEKVNGIIEDARTIADQASKLRDDITAADIEDFKDGLSVIKDDLKDLRGEIKEVKDSIKEIRWETLKEVGEVRKEVRKEAREEKKETAKEIREETKEKREEINEEVKSKREELKERIKKVREKSEREESR